MSYKCEICGKTFSTKKGPMSASHIKSKFHQDALNPQQKATIVDNRDLLIFMAISQLKLPTFPNITRFLTSFGVKNEEIIMNLMDLLRKELIQLNNEKIEDYKKIRGCLLTSNDAKYPWIFTFNEAALVFKDLNFGNTTEMVSYFQNLARTYPELVLLSSQNIDKPVDLISIRIIFEKDLTFGLKGAWNL